MHINNQTPQLASAFLIVSLAVNLIGPQSSAVSLATDDPLLETSIVEEITSRPAGSPSLEYLFFEPELLAHKEYIDHIIIGETGFLASKTPPNKKQIVILKMWMFITAYSSTPDQTDDTPFITASGSHVRDGVVAANFLPMGTKLRLPTMYGDKVFVVEDRMNSRYTYRIDIWMRTREEAKRFGLRNLPIEIIREI